MRLDAFAVSRGVPLLKSTEHLPQQFFTTYLGKKGWTNEVDETSPDSSDLPKFSTLNYMKLSINTLERCIALLLNGTIRFVERELSASA